MTPFTAFMAGLSIGLLIVGSAVALYAHARRRPAREPFEWTEGAYRADVPEFKPRARTTITSYEREIRL